MKKILILLTLLCSLPVLAQQRDSRVREYLSPTRIVWQQHSELIKDGDKLLLPGNGQAELTDRALCKMTSTSEEHPALCLISGKNFREAFRL